MSYTTKRFAVRTVCDGRVTIGGTVFRSQNMQDIQRFEGKRMAFGRYWTGDKVEPFVSLWGEESFFQCKTEEEIDAHPWPGIEAADDGYFRWEWWYDESKPIPPAPNTDAFITRDGNRFLADVIGESK